MSTVRLGPTVERRTHLMHVRRRHLPHVGSNWPQAPTTFTATATSSTVVHLTWTQTATPTNPVTTKAYEIQRTTPEDYTMADWDSPPAVSFWWIVYSTGTGIQSCDDGGLTPNTTYYYRIRAVGGENFTPTDPTTWTAVSYWVGDLASGDPGLAVTTPPAPLPPTFLSSLTVDPPNPLAGTGLSDTAVLLQWTSLTGATSYTVNLA